MKKVMIDSPDESAQEEAGESKKYEQHEIEGAADTLTKAESIKANPTLHAHAMKHLAKKAGHMNAAMGKKPGSLKELKDMAKSKAAAEVDDAG